MVEHMDKRKIIELKEGGHSNREVARRTGYDRDTVSKYWNEYRRRLQQLQEPGADTRAIQDSLFAAPRRMAAVRTRHKYTEEVDTRLKGILKEEEKKTRLLGPNHKQRLTNRQIHQKLVTEGFDVSEGTINISLAKIRKRQREVFIRQRYDLGDRLEYDFGEVDLIIGGVKKVCHMAVLSSPGGGFRWLYLYTNQKKAVFMDSHVKFFEMMGGSYFEVVYDNMRNVVKKFIELFLANKELPVDEIIALFERETANKGEIDALDVVKPVSQIVVSARAFIANYTALTMGGVQH